MHPCDHSELDTQHQDMIGRSTCRYSLREKVHPENGSRRSDGGGIERMSETRADSVRTPECALIEPPRDKTSGGSVDEGEADDACCDESSTNVVIPFVEAAIDLTVDDDNDSATNAFSEPNRVRGRSCRYNLREQPVPEKEIQNEQWPKQNDRLYNGEHSDECYVCDDGGNLLLCDYCEKSFHLQCHVPPLHKAPVGDWKCCECRAPEFNKRFKCGECPACTRENCRRCQFCRDMTKYGGAGIMKQACIEKRCPNKRYALPTVVTPTKVILEQRGDEDQAIGNQCNNPDASDETSSDKDMADDYQVSVQDEQEESSTDEESYDEDECYMCFDGGGEIK